MKEKRVTKRARFLAKTVGVACLLVTACGGAVNAPPPPPDCDEDCKNNIALRAIREAMRFSYNRLLQGKPMGPQDEMAPCPLSSGTVHIFGTATSNAALGTTEVHLTFDYQNCRSRFIHMTPERNYDLILTGSVKEDGLLVMSTGTTAVDLVSESMSFTGNVYDPPGPPFEGMNCPLDATQSGNNVTGFLCMKPAGFTGF